MQTSFVVISDRNHGKSETGDQIFTHPFSPRRQKWTEKFPFQNLQPGSPGFHDVGAGSTGATGQLINDGDFTKCESLFQVWRGCRKMPFKSAASGAQSSYWFHCFHIKCSAGGKIHLIFNQLNLNTETVKATTRTYQTLIIGIDQESVKLTETEENCQTRHKGSWFHFDSFSSVLT